MFVHPNIDPIIFQVGPLAIRWYGLMYLLGFAAFFYLGQKRLNRIGLNKEQFSDLLFYGAIFGVILGGRLGYALFYKFDRVLAEPLWLFKVWEGGMSFHGGIAGVLIFLAIYSWRSKRNMIDLMDFAGPLLLPGILAGRLANFINQELWGRPTDVPWAVLFPNDPSGLPRHASQLYEAFLEGLLLFIILWYFSQAPKRRGAVAGLGIMLYGVFRFIVEFFREPDAHLGFVAADWMSQGQVLSTPMIIGGGVLLLWSFTQVPTPVPTPVPDMPKNKPASKPVNKAKKAKKAKSTQKKGK